MILSSFTVHLIWAIVLCSLISDGQAVDIKSSSPDNMCKMTPSSLANISNIVNDLATNYYNDFASLTQSLQGMATLLQLDLVRQVITSSDDQLGNCSSSEQTLKNILRKLNNISDELDITLQAIATNVLRNQQAIDKMNKEQKPLLTSCKEVKMRWPHSVSGYYQLVGKKGPIYVYCHMEKLCSSGGGWTRIAYLDMSDSTEVCPPGFKLYQSGGIRACGKQSSSAGCQSVKFLSNGISYSQVCGRVVGYQYGSPDAVDKTLGTGHNNINSHYVDGISLTHGSPRQHIWTFMAGLIDSSIYLDGRFNCPCSQGSTQKTNLQSFIGNDYFCESGNQDLNGQFMFYRLYTDDPLWDGSGCGSLENTCCQAPGLPWFYKALNFNTTDYIEMRVCGDQSTGDEDVPVSYYEIYVK